MNGEAESRIRQAITDHGPITFAEFMHAALYGPGGYYASGSPVSASGDYFTAASAHPLFGALIAVQLHQMWQLLGSPGEFIVIEVGAGNGGLAADITEFAPQLDPAFTEALNYLAYDVVPPSHQHYPAKTASELPKGITGCILSNELLDAMPVHRFEVRDGTALELFVDLKDGELVNLALPPSTPLIEERLHPFLPVLPNGYRGEVNTGLDGWAAQQSQVLKKGWTLTIDYGFDRSTLYRPERTTGSLRCYYQHVLSQDPLRHVGKQDITAHVDFTAVDEAMSAYGFSSGGSAPQGTFLSRLGLEQAFARLQEIPGLSRPDRRANEMGIRSLVDAEGMGRFIVTAHGRNAPETALTGFAGDSEGIDGIPVLPLLSPDRHINLTASRQSAPDYFEVQSLEDLFSD